MKCLTHNETLDYITKNSYGTSRFGDGGLLGLLNDAAITHPTGAQKPDKKMSDRLYNIFKESPKTPNHIICIPPVYTLEHLELSKKYSAETNSRELWEYKFSLRDALHIKLHKIINSLSVKPDLVGCGPFNRLRYAYDSSIDGMGYIRKFAQVFKGKNVIHVSGYPPCVNPLTGEECPLLKKEYFKLATSLEFIETPQNDSYSNYESIFSQCTEAASNYKNNNIVFHLSFGPAASIMSLDLCKLGFQALDMGLYHLLEELKSGMV